MQNFFIFGLPRSRTAWVANLLCWSHSFCYHEAFATLQLKEEDLKREFQQFPNWYIVGNSDSANLLKTDWILENFPTAKLVYLERSEEAVTRSMEKVQPDLAHAIPMLREMARFAKQQIHNRGGLIIDVDRWCPADTFQLWNYCLPDIPYPKERNDQLEWMRVTITEDRWDYLKEQAKLLVS
jgi:hypothetical protein